MFIVLTSASGPGYAYFNMEGGALCGPPSFSSPYCSWPWFPSRVRLPRFSTTKRPLNSYPKKGLRGSDEEEVLILPERGIIIMNGKKLVSLALVISVVMFCPLLEAKERQGAHLKITNKDGGQLEEELIAVKPTSLLLLSGGGSDVSADIVGIDNIKIVKKSKAVTGMLIGLGAGAVVGGIIGATEEADLFSPADHILGGAAVLGVVGLVAGGVTGLIISRPETIKIGGMDESGTKAALEKLRKQARVPDFK